MKKILICLALAAIPLLHAQEFKGIAVYESFTVRKDMDVNVSGKLDPDTEARLKERLSKPIVSTYILTFDKSSSLYEYEQKLEAPVSGRVRPRTFTIGKKYNNLKEKISLEEKDLLGKEFLVMDSLKKIDWKLENETKKIGDYTCYKAIYTVKFEPPKTESGKDTAAGLTSTPRKDTVITAWYAPEIPVSHGPSYYWGLPGLILGVSTEHTTILCSKLTLNPKEKVEIKAPTKGEKITREQYNETMRKKMEETRDMRSSPPVIRRRN
jgi:GLPGLI family protein